MKILLKPLLSAMLVGALGLANAAEDASRGTADEAVALAKKALVYYKANGRDKLAAEINSRSPQFVEKDLYLFMSPVTAGPVIAHGANQKLVGRTLDDLRDVDGVYFTRKFREVAGGKEGKGWVDYKWPTAKSGQFEPKSTYVERVDDVYIACGAYKPAK